MMARTLRWAVFVCGLMAALTGGMARAQQPPPQVSASDAGSLRVSSSTWTFDADITLAGGPWTSAIVTNLSSCARPLPQEGAAQAGAVVFTAQLSAVATQTPNTLFQGDLLPLRGSKATGYVLITTPQSPDEPTHVDAGLFGIEQFNQDITLRVCLVTGPGTPAGSGAASSLAGQVLAGMQQALGMGYDSTGVVTTYGPDGSSFIGISGAKIGTADGADQWVFFFSSGTYLGTDTAVSSPFLSLAGSPGPGQIDVKYVAYAPDDPLCCASLPPVTITYTWDGTSVTASGTPPGH